MVMLEKGEVKNNIVRRRRFYYRSIIEIYRSKLGQLSYEVRSLLLISGKMLSGHSGSLASSRLFILTCMTPSDCPMYNHMVDANFQSI